MKIAVVSSTTIPATLPDDPHFFTTYGSEVYNAVLVKGLADRGHNIGWYAPVKSTMFYEYFPQIIYHPIRDSKGQHLPDERLEKIGVGPLKTSDLLDYDFVIDMSKQGHISDELYQYHDFKKYVNYRSGYQDFNYPMMASKHFVTHCQTFADNFKKNGFEADVCRFGIPDFWCPIEVIDSGLDLPEKYYLYPHRPSYQKGFDKLMALASSLPDKQFVISTAAVFEDHIKEMSALRKSNLPSNLKIVDMPQNINYHRYRRALMRNATAVLSPFTTKEGYMDTGGLVSFEAIRCGCPVIVTRSPSSTEMLGSLDGNGVEFVGDDIDSLKQVLRHDISRPKVDNTWMPVDTFIDDYLRIMEKYK